MKKIFIITGMIALGASMTAMSDSANPDLPENGIAALSNAISGISGFRLDGKVVPIDSRIAELLSRCDSVHTNAYEEGDFVWLSYR